MRRAITGLCYTQHKRMDYLVEMARAAGKYFIYIYKFNDIVKNLFIIYTKKIIRQDYTFKIVIFFRIVKQKFSTGRSTKR